MTTATLMQVQQQVDQLSPVEQIRLLDYISSQILKAVTSIQISSVSSAPKDTSIPIEWEELFQVGGYIANLPSHGEETMTQSVSTMRR